MGVIDVVAYVGDGFLVCTECVTFEESESDDFGVVFSTSEAHESDTCDRCEQNVWEVLYGEQDWGGYGDDA